jgi:ferritin-like metal-binding protein YciE
MTARQTAAPYRPHTLEIYFAPAGTISPAASLARRADPIPVSPTPKEEAMTVKTLEDLFHETLKDIYYAEKKLVKTLPKMAKKASAPELKETINGHLSETEIHVERLEKIFNAIDKPAVAKKCEAMDGLLKEAEEVMSEIEDDETLDAAIISSAQTVEHYEIARYGTLATWAGELGHKGVVQLLEETLQEEKNADEKLSDLAEDAVNQKAAA